MHTISEDRTYLPPSTPWNEGDIPAICIKVEKAEGRAIETLTWCVLEDGAKIDRIIVNPESNKETTALERAVEHEHEKIVKLLLKNGACAKLSNKSNEMKSLTHVAVEGGRPSILELLIEHGAHVDASDETYSTPLHHAIRLSRMDLVEILLDAGADIHAPDKKRKTPVNLAVDLRDVTLLQMLLKYNRSDRTFYLHDLAIEVERSNDRRNSMDIKKLLVRHGQGLTCSGKMYLISPPQAIADSLRKKFRHH